MTFLILRPRPTTLGSGCFLQNRLEHKTAGGFLSAKDGTGDVGGSGTQVFRIAGVFLTQTEAAFYFRTLCFIGLGVHALKSHVLLELNRTETFLGR